MKDTLFAGLDLEILNATSTEVKKGEETKQEDKIEISKTENKTSKEEIELEKENSKGTINVNSFFNKTENSSNNTLKSEKIVETKTTDKIEEEKLQEEKVLYTAIAEDLHTNSIITNFDKEKFEGKPESLREAIANEIEEKVKETINGFPPLIKYLAENWKEGVNIEDLMNIKTSQIKYDNISEKKLEEDINLQKEICRQHFKETTAWNDKRIEQHIQTLEDSDKLKEESKEALEEIKILEEEKEQELIELTASEKAKWKRQQEDDIKLVTESTNTLKEIIPGISLTEKEKKELIKNLTVPVAYNGNKEPISFLMKLRAEDPLGFEQKINYYAIKGLFNKEIKADILFNKAKSIVAKNIEKDLEEQNKVRKPGGNNISTEPDEGMDLLNAAKKKYKFQQKSNN